MALTTSQLPRKVVGLEIKTCRHSPVTGCTTEKDNAGAESVQWELRARARPASEPHGGSSKRAACVECSSFGKGALGKLVSSAFNRAIAPARARPSHRDQDRQFDPGEIRRAIRAVLVGERITRRRGG